ncbi:MAG: glucosaminidase domain-containing protein [Chlamydiales bacterium]|nr:glucosaminidase domain-containing protein [Chlamydiales bacterium]
MQKLFLSLIFCLCFFSSCHKGPNNSSLISSYVDRYTPTKIMSRGKLSAQHLSHYLLANNRSISKSYAKNLAKTYIQESRIEGVNHDIAFAQMCHETNFLSFGNQVSRKQNNFSGLGATDDGAKGATFPSAAVGVRAQIQHLKAYASKKAIRQKIVDPRFHLVTRGSAPTIFELTGRWATDSNYDQKILRHIRSLYETAGIAR